MAWWEDKGHTWLSLPESMCIVIDCVLRVHEMSLHGSHFWRVDRIRSRVLLPDECTIITWLVATRAVSDVEKASPQCRREKRTASMATLRLPQDEKLQRSMKSPTCDTLAKARALGMRVNWL
jgi:hypothetical protein